MNGDPVFLVNRMVIRPEPRSDRLVRWLLVGIALALAWQTLRPHAGPAPAEASREATAINIERVGGRFLTEGVIPVKCIR
jgi:hypothetical protein